MPVERIENLPAGTRLFLDANIFVYAFLGHSNQCRELLGRCATEQMAAPKSRLDKDPVDIAQSLKSKARTIIEERILAEYRKVIGDPMP